MDPSDIGSEAQARRVMAAAMVAIGRADDPQDAFDENARVIMAALEVLGPEHRLTQSLCRQGLRVPDRRRNTDKLVAAFSRLFSRAGYALED